MFRSSCFPVTCPGAPALSALHAPPIFSLARSGLQRKRCKSSVVPVLTSLCSASTLPLTPHTISTVCNPHQCHVARTTPRHFEDASLGHSCAHCLKDQDSLIIVTPEKCVHDWTKFSNNSDLRSTGVLLVSSYRVQLGYSVKGVTGVVLANAQQTPSLCGQTMAKGHRPKYHTHVRERRSGCPFYLEHPSGTRLRR